MIPLRARIVLLLALLAPTAACSSAWWQTVASNPLAAVTSFTETVLNWLGLAAQIFATVKPLLPADSQESAAFQFDRAVAETRAALAVLHDAADAAVIAKNDHPDFTKLTQDVVNGVQQIRGIVDAFRTHAKPGAFQGKSAPVGYETWTAMQTTIEKKR